MKGPRQGNEVLHNNAIAKHIVACPSHPSCQRFLTTDDGVYFCRRCYVVLNSDNHLNPYGRGGRA